MQDNNDSLFYFTATPKIIQMPTCEKVGNVTFCQCYGTGYPEPHIFWSKHGINETHLSTSSALNITHDPKNDGTYYCHMNNSKGYVKAAVTVAFFGKFFQIVSKNEFRKE